MDKYPKILMPMRIKTIDPDTSPSHIARETYVKKMLQYGLAPIFISPITPIDMADELYGLCSGLVCTGGNDFDPSHYNEKKHKKSSVLEKERDVLELHLIKKSIADKKPFFGICRGAQALAIAGGGSLYQHIPDSFEGNNHDIDIDKVGYDGIGKNMHEVNIVRGSRAHNLIGKEKIIVSSGHHQSVKTLGSEMRVSGVSPDGVTEIIEHSDLNYFCFGVQCHPEFFRDSDIEPIFINFANSVKKYKIPG